MNYSLCGFSILHSYLVFFSVIPFFVGAEPEETKGFPEDEIVFPETLLNISGEKVATEKIGEKYVGIYFSASWCVLAGNLLRNIEFRNKHSKEFEVIIGRRWKAKGTSELYEKIWYAMARRWKINL